MSYILGALRKAEQERKQDQAIESADWDSAEWNSHDSKNVSSAALKAILSVVILLLVVISVLLWRLLSEDAQPEGILGSAVSTTSETKIESSESDRSDMTPVDADEFESAGEETRFEDLVDELASDSADQGPKIPEITGHLYFPQNSALSRIFSGEGSYRVGHQFEDGLTLVSVSQNLAVFDWRGETFEIILR